MDDDLLWRHLKDLPAFRALLRAVEARFYQGLLPLEEPVLDVGCGDGHFASVALPCPLTAGIDPAAGTLREAQERGAYRLVARSLGDALPFAGNTFATVISNSVLEHIPEVDPVLGEVARVLKPGGRFIFCVPGDHFAEMLFFTQLFHRLRLEGLAHGYERYFNRISRHYHCDDISTWRSRLEQAGFVLDQAWPYFSRGALAAPEWGHYLGLPSLVSKKLTGHWVLWPSRINLWPTARLLRRYYHEELPQAGAYLFFAAHKASTQAQEDFNAHGP